MYTVVFKCKIDDLLVFDAYKENFLGKRLIGNVYCFKNSNGKYQARSRIFEKKWDGGKSCYFLETSALETCHSIFEASRAHWRVYKEMKSISGIIEKIEFTSGIHIKFKDGIEVNALDYGYINLSLVTSLKKGDEIKVTYYEEANNDIMCTKIDKI